MDGARVVKLIGRKESWPADVRRPLEPVIGRLEHDEVGNVGGRRGYSQLSAHLPQSDPKWLAIDINVDGRMVRLSEAQLDTGLLAQRRDDVFWLGTAQVQCHQSRRWQSGRPGGGRGVSALRG